jgi:hypothetical protein
MMQDKQTTKKGGYPRREKYRIGNLIALNKNEDTNNRYLHNEGNTSGIVIMTMVLV